MFVGPFGSPTWIAEYRRRVDGVTRELIADGIYVVWLGLPIPDGAGFRKSFPIASGEPNERLMCSGFERKRAHAPGDFRDHSDIWHANPLPVVGAMCLR